MMGKERPNVYIASSWKNFQAVKMLTAILRHKGYDVISFVEQGKDDPRERPKDFTEWIWSEFGESTFKFDTNGATKSDGVVYLGPSGTDAWAEVGAAWAANVHVFGLSASKGENAGIMRRMVHEWCRDFEDLLLIMDVYFTGMGNPPKPEFEGQKGEKDKLKNFLYILLDERVPIGTVWQIMERTGTIKTKDTEIEKIAEDMAAELTP